MNKSIITWILLLAFTLASYIFAESSIGRFSILALMGIALAKCSIVGFQFMELHKAHIVWRIAFLSVFGIFMVIVSAAILVR